LRRPIPASALIAEANATLFGDAKEAKDFLRGKELAWMKGITE
jgi:hypothetical protein